MVISFTCKDDTNERLSESKKVNNKLKIQFDSKSFPQVNFKTKKQIRILAELNSWICLTVRFGIKRVS